MINSASFQTLKPLHVDPVSWFVWTCVVTEQEAGKHDFCGGGGAAGPRGLVGTAWVKGLHGNDAHGPSGGGTKGDASGV